MTSNPLVSIITPTYNHEKYIGECIQSAINQTYTDWEMIIVDDGSTDNTLTIANKYAAIDNRIKVFTQKNIGIFKLAETYNFALNLSQGQFIAILEGDDYWFSDKLEIQVNRLQANKNAILSWGQAFCSSHDLSQNYSLGPDIQNNTECFCNKPNHPILKELIFRNIITALTIVVRKSSILQIGGFKQKFHLPLIDIPTLQELAFIGEFDFVPKPLGKWRNYNTQMTKTHPVPIYAGLYALATDLYTNKKELITKFGITQKMIDHYFKNIMVVTYSRSGRYKLIRNDFEGARADYYKSIFSYGFRNPIWKLRSLIGVVFSFFHLNIENLVGILGRRTYSK